MVTKKIEPGRIKPWTKTILGQPYSKANSRMLVTIGGKPRFIKSPQALAYVEAFQYQCPILTPMFTGPVCVEAVLYYKDNRPDLDESLVLDCLQGRVYLNDRQVKRKVITHGLDPNNPRAELQIYSHPATDDTE